MTELDDTIEFGDITPEDAYDVEGVADPDQVAYRLHELRRYIDQLAGHDPGAFDALDPDEQILALAIGKVIVDWLANTDPDHPERTARQLHNVRRFWSANTMPAWEDLPDDQRDLAVDLMRQIIDWLRREGSLR